MAAPPDPYVGLLDAVASGRDLRLRRWFGFWAYYDEERLIWVSAHKREPWRGILVPTEKRHQPALRATLPALRVHPVLGKWLYLPARHREFEAMAERLADLIAAGDERIGIVPAPRAPRRKERRS